MNTIQPVIDHEARRKRLGASEVAAVLNLSPYTTPWEVWANKVGILTPFKGNAATKAGNRLEDVILDYAEEDLGRLERQKLILADGTPIASTLDAEAVEANGEPVEAKSAGILSPVMEDWGSTELEEVPQHYYVQVQTQLYCTKKDLGYLYAMLGGIGIRVYPIRRSPDLQKMVDFLCAWWDRHVIGGDEPERTEPIPLELLKRRIRTPEKVVDLPLSIEALLEERNELKERNKENSQRLDAIDSEILTSLGDAEAGNLPGKLITYFESNRKGYTVQPTTFRTLRIKKAKA